MIIRKLLKVKWNYGKSGRNISEFDAFYPRNVREFSLLSYEPFDRVVSKTMKWSQIWHV